MKALLLGLLFAGLPLAAQIMPAIAVLDSCGYRPNTSSVTNDVVYEDSPCGVTGSSTYKDDGVTPLFNIYSVLRTTPFTKTLITTSALRTALGVAPYCNFGDPTITPSGRTLAFTEEDDLVPTGSGGNCASTSGNTYYQQDPGAGGGFGFVTCSVPVTSASCQISVVPGAYAVTQFGLAGRYSARGGGIDSGACNDSTCLVWSESLFASGSSLGYGEYALTYLPLTEATSPALPTIGTLSRICIGCDVTPTGAPAMGATPKANGCVQYVKPNSVIVSGSTRTIYYQEVLGAALGTSTGNYCFDNGWTPLASGMSSITTTGSNWTRIWPLSGWGTALLDTAGSWVSYAEFSLAFVLGGNTYVTLYSDLSAPRIMIDLAGNLHANAVCEMGILPLSQPGTFWFLTDLNRAGSPLRAVYGLVGTAQVGPTHPTINLTDRVICFGVRGSSSSSTSCGSLNYPGSRLAPTSVLSNAKLSNGTLR